MTPSNELARLYPALKMQKSLRPQQAGIESFVIDMKVDSIHLEAESKPAQEFAMHQLLAALQSNRLGDFIGPSTPLYAMRPLWIHGGCLCRLPSGIEVNLPEFLFAGGGDEIDVDILHTLVWHLYDLGFNAVIFAPQKEHARSIERTITTQALHKALDFIRSFGVVSVLHFSPPPTDHKREISDWNLFFSQVAVLLDVSDFLFWSSSELWRDGFEPKKEKPQEFDKIREEIIFLQKMAKCGIFYYFPCSDMNLAQKQSPWLLSLATEVADTTVLSFSASAGSPFYEQSKLHPVFQEISRLPSPFQGRFVPFLGVRQYGSQEKVVIADCPFPFVEKTLGWQRYGRLYGAGCQVEWLPQVKSFASGVLWAIGQRMWRSLNTYGLFETWLLRYHSDIKECISEEFLDRFHKVVRAQSQVDMMAQEPTTQEKSMQFARKIEEAASSLQNFSSTVANFRSLPAFQEAKPSFVEFSEILQQFQKQVKEELEACCASCNIQVPDVLLRLEI